MAYSTPPTASPGSKLSAAQWNSTIRDSLEFLANPPACRVFHGSVQSVADGGETTLAFTGEDYDPTGMHSTTSLTSRITFNEAGVYIVSFMCEVAAAADYLALRARIVKNNVLNLGGTVIGTLTDSSIPPLLNLSVQAKMDATDYVEVRVYQNNSASAARNVLVTSGLSPYFSAIWVGRG